MPNISCLTTQLIFQILFLISDLTMISHLLLVEQKSSPPFFRRETNEQWMEGDVVKKNSECYQVNRKLSASILINKVSGCLKNLGKSSQILWSSQNSTIILCTLCLHLIFFFFRLRPWSILLNLDSFIFYWRGKCTYHHHMSPLQFCLFAHSCIHSNW